MSNEEIELLKLLQQNSENNKKLIDLLDQRIDQIWKILEIARIVAPTTNPITKERG